jgi:hypothetical protein
MPQQLDFVTLDVFGEFVHLLLRTRVRDQETSDLLVAFLCSLAFVR